MSKILAEEIKVYESTNGLGGAITGTEVTSGDLHNIFDRVEPDGALLGETNYRCVYVKNTNGTNTLLEAVTYLTVNTPSTTSNLFIGIGSSGISGIEQAIADEDTAPVGITFTDLINEAGVLAVGDVPAGGHFPVWLQRVIDVDAEAYAVDGVSISIQGKTGG